MNPVGHAEIDAHVYLFWFTLVFFRSLLALFRIRFRGNQHWRPHHPVRFARCDDTSRLFLWHTVTINACWSGCWRRYRSGDPTKTGRTRPPRKPPYQPPEPTTATTSAPDTSTCKLPSYVDIWTTSLHRLFDNISHCSDLRPINTNFGDLLDYNTRHCPRLYQRYRDWIIIFILSISGYADAYLSITLNYLVHIVDLPFVYLNILVLRLHFHLFAPASEKRRHANALADKILQQRRTDRKLVERKKNPVIRRSRFRKLLLALVSLPHHIHGAEHAWSQDLHSFVSSDTGWLDTSSLPPDKLLSLRSRLNDFGMEEDIVGLLQTTNLHPVVVDSGASANSSNNENDFEAGTLVPVKEGRMGGIASDLTIVSKGILRYELIGDNGKIVVLRCWGYYIPDLPIRLISPQTLLRDGVGDISVSEYSMTRDTSILRMANGTEISVPYNNVNRLPLLYVSKNIKDSEISFAEMESTRLLDEKNQNLSFASKVLLAFHQRLNHIGMSHIKWLAKQGYLGNKVTSALSKLDGDEPPKCATCLFGKQSRRPTKESKTKLTVPPEEDEIVSFNTMALPPNTRDTRRGILSATADRPGAKIAMDQYVHTTPGRGPSITGITPASVKYVGGTLFVDCATGYVMCIHQTSLGALETLMSKQRFEQDGALHGVQVKGYMTDNGVFTARSFIDEIQSKKQRIQFCGVNAHHQNAIAERSIKQTHHIARCMMLHAAIHWPEAYDPALWPFALSYACHVMNSLPRQRTNLSPSEQWHGIKVDHSEVLNSILPWGCPSYVLDATLANGGKIPKFKPRSRRGQFLGVSQYHSQKSVGLIRNLTTMRVSPQYHVVYDPEFSTTHSTEEDPPNEWREMVLSQRVQCDFGLGPYPDDDQFDQGSRIGNDYSDLPQETPFKLHSEWLDDDERLSRREEERKSPVLKPTPLDNERRDSRSHPTAGFRSDQSCRI